MSQYPDTFCGEPIALPDGHINPDMVNALKAYAEEAHPVGGFLRALLANDLYLAAMKADAGNARTLTDLAKFVYWNVPSKLRGSKEAVEAHIGPEK